MGLAISDIIPKKEIEISDLKGKTIAIDAFNILYQFLTTIRQYDGTPLMNKKGETTSHLSGLFYRNINLLLEGIKPVYVFDGKAPELKQQEIQKRKEQKKIAEGFYETAKEKCDTDSMKKYSARTVKITDTIIKQSKELLDAMGIPFVQANGEGEAEAAHLAKNQQVWASASQDYDSLLFQTPYLVRNLTLSKKRKTSSGIEIEVKPELIELKQVLNKLQIELDQLIVLGILVGTDYNPGGVKGLGQKRALEIVQKYKYPVEIFNHVKSKFDSVICNWPEIFSQFKEYKNNPKEEITFKKVNYEKLKQILEENDFSPNRINSGIEKLQKFEENQKQKGLTEFF